MTSQTIQNQIQVALDQYNNKLILKKNIYSISCIQIQKTCKYQNSELWQYIS